MRHSRMRHSAANTLMKKNSSLVLPMARFTALNSTSPKIVKSTTRAAAVRLQDVEHGVLETHVGMGVGHPALQQGKPAGKYPHGSMRGDCQNRDFRDRRIYWIGLPSPSNGFNPENPQIR